MDFAPIKPTNNLTMLTVSPWLLGECFFMQSRADNLKCLKILKCQWDPARNSWPEKRSKPEPLTQSPHTGTVTDITVKLVTYHHCTSVFTSIYQETPTGDHQLNLGGSIWLIWLRGIITWSLLLLKHEYWIHNLSFVSQKQEIGHSFFLLYASVGWRDHHHYHQEGTIDHKIYLHSFNVCIIPANFNLKWK